MSLENLLNSGALSLAQAETRRTMAEKRSRQKAKRRDQKRATVEVIDGEQGLVIAQAADGSGRYYSKSRTNSALGEVALSIPRKATVGSADAKPIGASLLNAEPQDTGTSDGGGSDGSGGNGDDAGGGDGDGGSGDRCSSQLLCYRGRCYDNPPEPNSGEFLLTGDYRFGNSQGAPGPSFNLTFTAASYAADPGLSSDETYFYIVDCEGSRTLVGNGFGGIKTSTYTISKVGEFSCFIPLGPSCSDDPEEWRSIISNNPPIKYSTDTNSDRSLITAWDGATSEASPLAQLDFEPGQYQIKIACKEDGCDTEPNCETQRFWSRPLPEPPDGDNICDRRYNAEIEFLITTSSDPDPRWVGGGVVLGFYGPVRGLSPINPETRPAALLEVYDANGDEVDLRARRTVGTYPDLNTLEARIKSYALDPSDQQPCPPMEPAQPGPWQPGVLSFNPPMQVNVAVDGDSGVHTLSIYDDSTTAADPLTTVTFPDDKYEYAVRCDGDGPPP